MEAAESSRLVCDPLESLMVMIRSLIERLKQPSIPTRRRLLALSAKQRRRLVQGSREAGLRYRSLLDKRPDIRIMKVSGRAVCGRRDTVVSFETSL